MKRDKCNFSSMSTIEDLSSYESPIQVACREVQNTFDGDVLKAVLSYGISVDKDELIRALQYDRNQYKKGFADGARVNLGEDVVRVVRCKDCKHGIRAEYACKLYCRKPMGFNGCKPTDENAFCSYGERKNDNDV